MTGCDGRDVVLDLDCTPAGCARDRCMSYAPPPLYRRGRADDGGWPTFPGPGPYGRAGGAAGRCPDRSTRTPTTSRALDQPRTRLYLTAAGHTHPPAWPAGPTFGLSGERAPALTGPHHRPTRAQAAPVRPRRAGP